MIARNSIARNSIARILTTLLLAATPAAARPAEWIVELADGSVFETRYEPTIDVGGDPAGGAAVDPADGAKVHLLTDQGNWIALPRSIVRRIRPRPVAGGRWLDGDTIELGAWPQLDLSPQGEPAGDATDPAEAFRNRLLATLERAPYSIDQFVEPAEAAGIPLPYGLTPLPEPGSPWRFVTAQERP